MHSAIILKVSFAQSQQCITGIKKVNILPYHTVAHKYLNLGEKYDSSTVAEPGEDVQVTVIAKLADFGTQLIVGG